MLLQPEICDFKTISVADIKENFRWAPPSWSNFLHFHAVFSEIWLNNRLALPFGFVPPHLGNPGSAAANAKTSILNLH